MPVAVAEFDPELLTSLFLPGGSLEGDMLADEVNGKSVPTYLVEEDPLFSDLLIFAGDLGSQASSMRSHQNSNSNWHVDGFPYTLLGSNILPSQALIGTIKIPERVIDVYDASRETKAAGDNFFETKLGKKIVASAIKAGTVEQVTLETGIVYAWDTRTVHKSQKLDSRRNYPVPRVVLKRFYEKHENLPKELANKLAS